MNALVTPPFPTNPQTGDYFGGYVWNGQMWLQTNSTGMRQILTVFAASGVYTPSPGLVTVAVECLGGGGAGGPAQMTYSGTAWKLGAAGGGGGAGAYARKVLDAALVLGGVVVTIGAGGNPGGSNSALAGGNGGTTSFGALCVANGGTGGGANSLSGNDTALTQTGQYGQGGPGGSGGVGDWVVPGNSGTLGSSEAEAATAIVQITVPIGRGGGGAYGGAPWGGLLLGGNTGGAVGTPAAANSGAGGGGGVCAVAPGGGPQNSFFGGAGGSGVCVVTESVMASGGPGCPPGCGAPIPDPCMPWQAGWMG